MPSAKKPIELYIAKSLKELREIACKDDSRVSSRPASTLSSVALKLYIEGLKCLQSDEERAYVLLYRYTDIAQKVRNKSECKSDKVFDMKKQRDTMTNLENLSKSLEIRYQLKKEKEDAANYEKMLNGVGDLKLPSPELKEKNKVYDRTASPDFSSQMQNGIHKTDESTPKDQDTMDCMELYRLMQDSGTSLIIFDCRSSAEFSESHISHSTCVNIPAEILKPGITARALGEALSREVRDLWNKRSLVDYIVLMDEDSSHKCIVPHSAINSLNLAISKWDTNNVLKRKPVILERGFQEWLLHYPTTVTKVPPISGLSLNNLELRNSLPYIDVDYPDLDDSDNEVMNTGFHEVSPSKANHPSVLQSVENTREVKSAFTIDKNVDHTLQATLKQRAASSSQVPSFDRSSKPSNEEGLWRKLTTHQEEYRLLEEKLKEEEQKKEAIQKEYTKTLAENQDIKKNMVADTDRLRQERKRLEQQKDKENEEKEKRTASSHPKEAPSRPSTAPSTKPPPPIPTGAVSGSVPGGSQKKQEVPGVYSARLKDESEKLSVSRGLSRSHSSPNIAQLLDEEDQKDNSIRPVTVHSHDRVLKHSKLGDECSPSINRALKPIDANVTRMRNFSPVFSSQPNTQTGLKNLGNTCFMNSVLQCLSHTQPLAHYLMSGTYLNDITRSGIGGSRGEVIQELASVFQNLWQTYRNISPHEFKNTVSRHMSICEGYDQQDAHEFLVVLMEKLHTETNKGVSSKGSNPPDLDKISSTEEALNEFWVWHLRIHNSRIVYLFEGVLQSRLTCAACNHRAYTYEVFSCLSLPIPSHSKCSLKDCIQSLLKAETIRGEAAWKCPNCKRKQEAEKKMGICRLPPILIIHLKRFSYEGLWRRKLVTSVDFPIYDLDMEPYLIVPAKKSKYRLYGVVNHYGTLEGGHYTAYCKSEKWFNFDDHEVQQVGPSSVKTSAAYILFYSSVD